MARAGHLCSTPSSRCGRPSRSRAIDPPGPQRRHGSRPWPEAGPCRTVASTGLVCPIVLERAGCPSPEWATLGPEAEVGSLGTAVSPARAHTCYFVWRNSSAARDDCPHDRAAPAPLTHPGSKLVPSLVGRVDAPEPHPERQPTGRVCRASFHGKCDRGTPARRSRRHSDHECLPERQGDCCACLPTRPEA